MMIARVPALFAFSISLTLFASPSSAEPAARLTKNKGTFQLTGEGVIPASMHTALPVLEDYATYAEWALKNINKPRKGKKKKYFLKIEELNHQTGTKEFALQLGLKLFFKGKHTLRLSAENGLNQSPPYISFRLTQPTRLVSFADVKVTLDETEGGRAIHAKLNGRAKTHWAFYYLVPLRMLRANAEDRVMTVLENAIQRISTNPA
jgi:hypothetical protein